MEQALQAHRHCLAARPAHSAISPPCFSGRQTAPALFQRSCGKAMPCRASKGFGFGQEVVDSSPKEPLVSPTWGLTTSQMAALGITNDTELARPEPDAELLRACAYYGGDPVQAMSYNTRQPVTMAAGTGAAPGQVPPDLPSLLLDARICFIGMPLVPAVTELIISELLWLNYSNPEKPVYLYVHSYGSQTPDGQTVGFETEAYAILDTLAYIKPDLHTLVVGEAMGNAAMIVASGKKGCRFALPHARMQTCPPRMNRSFGSTVNMMIKANELEYNTQQYVDFMAKYTGKSKEETRKDVGRNRYFTPKQAIEYGLIDHIVQKRDKVAMEKRDYEAALVRSQAGRGRAAAMPSGPSADAGY